VLREPAACVLKVFGNLARGKCWIGETYQGFVALEFSFGKNEPGKIALELIDAQDHAWWSVQTVPHLRQSLSAKRGGENLKLVFWEVNGGNQPSSRIHVGFPCQA
jgi:hypothetical protein